MADFLSGLPLCVCNFKVFAWNLDFSWIRVCTLSGNAFLLFRALHWHPTTSMRTWTKTDWLTNRTPSHRNRGRTEWMRTTITRMSTKSTGKATSTNSNASWSHVTTSSPRLTPLPRALQVRWWRHNKYVSDIMGFVRLFWATYMKKVRIF